MTSTERWATVPGFDYEVSDQGDVRSWRQARWRGPHRLQGTVQRDGRRHVTLVSEGGKRTLPVHRLVLLAFVGPCPDGMECRHLNGDPLDNRLANLAWGTKLENAADKVRHGTMVRGRAHWANKLTEAQVLEIRQSRGAQDAVAAAYGVSQALVSKIKRRERWAWVS